jgi:NAD(P)H-dependent FMN reductase
LVPHTVRPRIALIVASTRSTRFADKLLPWLADRLGSDAAFDLELIDLRDHRLPFYDLPTPPRMAHRHYGSEVEARLGALLDSADGYVVLTNEFNHGPSAELKNALDHYYVELRHKPIAFVGYGNVGAARAVEQLRLVVAELDMVSVRDSVHVLGPHFMTIRAGGDEADQTFTALDTRLQLLVENLLWWTSATRAARFADERASGHAA